MGVFDFLQTPIGIELSHAVIAVLLAVAGYFQFRTHQHVNTVSAKLDDHINQVASKEAASTDGK